VHSEFPIAVCLWRLRSPLPIVRNLAVFAGDGPNTWSYPLLERGREDFFLINPAHGANATNGSFVRPGESPAQGNFPKLSLKAPVSDAFQYAA